MRAVERKFIKIPLDDSTVKPKSRMCPREAALKSLKVFKIDQNRECCGEIVIVANCGITGSGCHLITSSGKESGDVDVNSQ